MGFLEVLTLIFIFLKMTIHPEWTWTFTLMPLIISFTIYAVMIVVFIIYSVAQVNGEKSLKNSRFRK